MVVENRDSGFKLLGNVPWGAHICLLFSTKKDLISTLLLYMQAGLKKNEFCLWITPDSFTLGETSSIIRGSLPRFSGVLRDKRLEIISFTGIDIPSGTLNPAIFHRALDSRLKQAIDSGCEGLRVALDLSGLKKAGWLKTVRYMAEPLGPDGGAPMLALCAYPLDKCGVQEYMDILDNGNFHLIVANGKLSRPRSSQSPDIINNIQKRYRSRIDKIKQKLRESEDKYEKALRGSDIMVCITTLAEGTFLDVNDNFCRIFGYRREEMIGHTSTELNMWTPESRALVVEKFNKSKRIQNEKTTLRTSSGELLTVLFSVELISINGQQRLISVLTDITRLQDLQEKNQAITGTIIDGFCIIGSDGRFIEVNDSYCRMTGYTREELLKMSVSDIDVPENAEDVARRIDNTMQKGSNNFFTRIRRKDGRMVDIEVRNGFFNAGRGQFFAFVREANTAGIVPAFHKDRSLARADGGEEDYEIVVQKLKKELVEAEDKYNKAANASPSIISVTTLKEGKFLDINDNFTRILGYTRDEVIGHTSFELDLWKDQKFRERVFRKLTEDGRIQDEVFFPRTKSGETLVVKFSCELHDINGQPCIITVMTDITKLQKLEEAQKAVLSTAIDGFWITDLHGKFLEVNDSYCQMIGYTREELLKMSISDVEAIESPRDTERRIKRLIVKGTERFLTRHRCKDGTVLDIEINTSHYNVGQGQLFVFIHNITGKNAGGEVLSEVRWRKNITRLQEKFVKEGFENFEDREIIELLFSMVIPSRKAAQLAGVCMEKFKNLGAFLTASPEELTETGVTPSCVFCIAMLHKLPIKVLQEKIREQSIYDSPRDIFNYLYYSMRDANKELFKVILLNSRNQIIEVIDLFEGSMDKIPIDTREVIEKALTHKPKALVFVHNHPSGDPSPSRDDKRLTRDLVFIGNILGIKVVDHIIIGNNRYYSFADEGLIREYEFDFLNLRLRGTSEAKRRISRARISGAGGPPAV